MCNIIELLELKIHLKAEQDPEVTKFFDNYLHERQD